MAIISAILRRFAWFAGMGFLALSVGPAFDAAEASGGTWRFAAPQQRLFRPLLADPTEARMAVTSNLDDRLNGDIGGSWEAAGLCVGRGPRAAVPDRDPCRRILEAAPVGNDLPPRDRRLPDRLPRGPGQRPDDVEVRIRPRERPPGRRVRRVRRTGPGGPGGPGVQGGQRGTSGPGRTQATRAMTYSREYFTLFGAREMRLAPGSAIGSAIGSARVYGSLRWSNHAIPDVRRWRVQGGAELVFRPLSGDWRRNPGLPGLRRSVVPGRGHLGQPLGPRGPAVSQRGFPGLSPRFRIPRGPKRTRTVSPPGR